MTTGSDILNIDGSPLNIVKYSDILTGNIKPVFIEIEEKWHGSVVEKACVVHRDQRTGFWSAEYSADGTQSRIPIDLRAFVTSLTTKNSDAIILSHFHPSGSTHPSQDDLRMTKSIARICDLFNISLIDHLILGTGPCFSFRSANLL